jgi:hypothetical protein
LPSALESALQFISSPRRPARPDYSHLRLHAKPVAGTVSFSALLDLPSHDSSVREECRHQLRWLTDVTRYSAVPRRDPDDIPEARLSDDDIEAMLRVGHIMKVDRSFVQGGVRMFTVPELAKNRRRAIKWTRDANDVLPSAERGHEVRMATKTQIVKLVHGGSHFAALDLAAWFDQLPYHRDVSRLFCFKHKGQFYSLPVCSMGSRVSVSVASAVTWQLLNFQRRSARCEIVIDNIIFVGSAEDVLHDVLEFRRRCAAVGAVLNDIEQPAEQLVVTKGDWCGVVLDLTAKTVCLTEKSVGRTALAWATRQDWSWRGFSACVGLLFWSHGILECDVHRRFNLLSFISRVSADLTECPELWDAPCQVWPSAMKDIEEWCALIARNEPRVVPKEIEPEWIVATDASRWGWGYLAVSAAGEIRTHGAPWSRAMEQAYGDRLGQSTFAEPRAVINALCHIVAPRDGVKRVKVLCDNSGTVFAFNRGFSSHALHLNQGVGDLRKMLPGTDVELVHIEGIHNPADKPSRGGVLSEEEKVAAALQLRRHQ